MGAAKYSRYFLISATYFLFATRIDLLKNGPSEFFVGDRVLSRKDLVPAARELKFAHLHNAISVLSASQGPGGAISGQDPQKNFGVFEKYIPSNCLAKAPKL